MVHCRSIGVVEIAALMSAHRRALEPERGDDRLDPLEVLALTADLHARRGPSRAHTSARQDEAPR